MINTEADWSFDAADVASWSAIDFGPDRDNYITYQPVSMGFTGIDLFETDGIYETCYNLYYFFEYAVACGYEHMAVLYDGATVGIYEKAVYGGDWYDYNGPGTDYVTAYST
jgi:hypothetical protein